MPFRSPIQDSWLKASAEYGCEVTIRTLLHTVGSKDLAQHQQRYSIGLKFAIYIFLE